MERVIYTEHNMCVSPIRDYFGELVSYSQYSPVRRIYHLQYSQYSTNPLVRNWKSGSRMLRSSFFDKRRSTLAARLTCLIIFPKSQTYYLCLVCVAYEHARTVQPASFEKYLQRLKTSSTILLIALFGLNSKLMPNGLFFAQINSGKMCSTRENMPSFHSKYEKRDRHKTIKYSLNMWMNAEEHTLIELLQSAPACQTSGESSFPP